MLHVLDKTEEFHRKPLKNSDLPSKMFMSKATLLGWKINIHSMILLIEELLGAGYITVLSGKFNPIKVKNCLKIVFINTIGF